VRRLDIDTGDVTFVAADFTRDDIPAHLAAAGVDPRQRALHLCEGVAGYLDAAVLTGLLRALAGSAAPRSTLAMTIPFTPGPGRFIPRQSRLAAAVARIGEPFKFALPRAALDEFLAGAGWRTATATDPAGTPVATSRIGSGFVLAHSPTG
jgi:O-methyltransferase involved in polyketide biosynthesis